MLFHVFDSSVLKRLFQKDQFSSSPRRELNSRPLVYETSALTTELRRLTDTYLKAFLFMSHFS